MSADIILVDVADGVATVTLNRPERLNAMSYELMNLLPLRLRELTADLLVRSLVLTGAGRAFCAGGDIQGMVAGEGEPLSFEQEVEQQQGWHSVTALLHEMRKPTIAMVNGAAAGAGLSLAMACDLRIAASSARFGTAFMRVGFSGDFGGTWLLTQLVGTAKARELYFSGELLNAEDALRLGLVNRVVPDAELRDQTMTLARQIAAGPSVAYGYMKENLNLAQHSRLQDILDTEARAHRRTGHTDDHKEASRAFLEKRPPAFRGQ
ncbi:MAG: enoyl-CoA hydratase [Dehalococcoidia bacterium]